MSGLWQRVAQKRSSGRFSLLRASGLLAALLLCWGLLSVWSVTTADISTAGRRDCVSVAFAAQKPAAAAGEQRVREVIDGDTLRLDSGVVVRLKEIDAPELGHGKAPDQYYAQQARDGLRALSLGRGIRLETGVVSADRYGRVLACAYGADGRCLNEVLLEQGLAVYYPHPGQPSPLSGRLLGAQVSAMDRGAGFWATMLRRPEMKQPCVGNSRSLRFFPAGCRFGNAIRRSGRVAFASAEQAFRAGYAPARPCGFWPLADAVR